jgi:hypothetical protein
MSRRRTHAVMTLVPGLIYPFVWGLVLMLLGTRIGSFTPQALQEWVAWAFSVWCLGTCVVAAYWFGRVRNSPPRLCRQKLNRSSKFTTSIAAIEHRSSR